MAAYVNRRTLTLAGVVFLAVTAMAMSAATLDSAEGATPIVGEDRSPSEIDGSGNGNQGSSPDGSDVLTGGEASEGTTISLSGCISFLASTPGTLLYFAGIGGFFFALKQRFSTGIVLLSAYVVTPVALAFYFLRTKCSAAGGGAGSGGGDGGAGLLTSTPPSLSVPPSVMLGLFALLFVGVGAAVYYTSNTPTYATREDEAERDGETDVRDIAAAAAEAADRIQERNADVDNEVYRAWWEMTQLLDVSSPEAYTPNEFAEAAMELGIDESYVDSLTTLFNEVRYGHADPAKREQQALEVFQAIEAEYGDDGARSGPPDSDGPTEGDE